MTRRPPVEPINLSHFAEEFFRHAIRRHVQEYVAHFGERLAAIYVFGSVHRNEAVPGVSDLDLDPYLSDAPYEEDRKWWERTDAKLEREFGVACGLARPHPLAGLLRLPPPVDVRPQMWYPRGAEVQGYPLRVQADWLRMRRYDATLVWGRDITEGRPIPPMDLLWARDQLPDLRDYIRDAAGLPNEGRFDPQPLPRQPSLRLRKLARYAVCGGAFLLAGLGEFRSFRGADVIPALEPCFTQWNAFLEQTRRLYIHPADPSQEEVAAYLSRLVEWLDWIGNRLDC